MRTFFLAFLTVLPACLTPVVPLNDLDAAEIIAEHGYRVERRAVMSVVGFTDCALKRVLVLEGVPLDAVLVHEAVHVQQAEEMGCGRFYAKWGLDAVALERPAYQQLYRFLDCDSERLEADVAELYPEIELGDWICEETV